MGDIPVAHQRMQKGTRTTYPRPDYRKDYSDAQERLEEAIAEQVEPDGGHSVDQVMGIDPDTCGCTDCITGRTVPLSRATFQQVRDMLDGKLQNRTSIPNGDFTVVTIIQHPWTDQSWASDGL
jgi:hypothetical protein